jgi:glycosyltransferase involved in cell wall biosynthesis
MRAQHVINALPILNKDTDFSPPMLSVIIAARNEGKTLSHALDTLIQQSYPQLEIIIVNDRSSDNTAAIIDEYAARDPRIHPIHISTLADEWLGKTHALHFASQQARGEWFLFTDADVHHSTRLWASAIHYAQEQQLDHLALLPKIT